MNDVEDDSNNITWPKFARLMFSFDDAWSWSTFFDWHASLPPLWKFLLPPLAFLAIAGLYWIANNGVYFLTHL